MNSRIFPAVLLLSLFLPAIGSAGTVTGTVSAPAEKNFKAPSRYYRGPFRGKPNNEPAYEGGPEQVVVYLEGVPGQFSGTERRASVIQRDETFVPHVLPVLKGTIVEFPNQDNFYHNVFSVVAGDRFDLGRYAKGESSEQVLDTPGVVVVRCEIHSRMKAYVLVLDNPYFTVPEPSGRFSIPDVPAGKYMMKAWSPAHGEHSQEITVPASGTVTLNISF